MVLNDATETARDEGGVRWGEEEREEWERWVEMRRRGEGGGGEVGRG